MKYLFAFSCAVSLLTRIPLPRRFFPAEVDHNSLSLSALFYPLIGALIGIALFLVAVTTTAIFPPQVSAAMVLLTWIVITGALHLDGLADSTDAYFASHGKPEKTLEVFRDPAAGPMAVVAIVGLLLFKVILLYELIQQQHFLGVLIVSPMLARLLAVIYLATTPYAREDGIASGINVEPARVSFILLVALSLLTSTILLPIKAVMLISLFLLACLLIWRRIWIKRISGFTGDTLGALIEIAELIPLILILIF